MAHYNPHPKEADTKELQTEEEEADISKTTQGTDECCEISNRPTYNNKDEDARGTFASHEGTRERGKQTENPRRNLQQSKCSSGSIDGDSKCTQRYYNTVHAAAQEENGAETRYKNTILAKKPNDISKETTFLGGKKFPATTSNTEDESIAEIVPDKQKNDISSEPEASDDNASYIQGGASNCPSPEHIDTKLGKNTVQSSEKSDPVFQTPFSDLTSRPGFHHANHPVAVAVMDIPGGAFGFRQEFQYEKPCDQDSVAPGLPAMKPKIYAPDHPSGRRNDTLSDLLENVEYAGRLDKSTDAATLLDDKAANIQHDGGPRKRDWNSKTSTEKRSEGHGKDNHVRKDSVHETSHSKSDSSRTNKNSPPADPSHKNKCSKNEGSPTTAELAADKTPAENSGECMVSLEDLGVPPGIIINFSGGSVQVSSQSLTWTEQVPHQELEAQPFRRSFETPEDPPQTPQAAERDTSEVLRYSRPYSSGIGEDSGATAEEHASEQRSVRTEQHSLQHAWAPSQTSSTAEEGTISEVQCGQRSFDAEQPRSVEIPLSQPNTKTDHITAPEVELVQSSSGTEEQPPNLMSAAELTSLTEQYTPSEIKASQPSVSVSQQAFQDSQSSQIVSVNAREFSPELQLPPQSSSASGQDTALGFQHSQTQILARRTTHQEPVATEQPGNVEGHARNIHAVNVEDGQRCAVRSVPPNTGLSIGQLQLRGHGQLNLSATSPCPLYNYCVDLRNETVDRDDFRDLPPDLSGDAHVDQVRKY